MSLVKRWRSNDASAAIFDPNEMPLMWHDANAPGFSLAFRTSSDESLSSGAPPPGWASLARHAAVFNNADASWSPDTFYTVASASGSGVISTIITPKITTASSPSTGKRLTIEITLDGTVYAATIEAAAAAASGRLIFGAAAAVKAPFTATATYSSAHVDKDEFRQFFDANGPVGISASKCGVCPPAILIPTSTDAKRAGMPFLAFRESFTVRIKAGLSVTASGGDHYSAVVYELNKFA